MIGKQILHFAREKTDHPANRCCKLSDGINSIAMRGFQQFFAELDRKLSSWDEDAQLLNTLRHGTGWPNLLQRRRGFGHITMDGRSSHVS